MSCFESCPGSLESGSRERDTEVRQACDHRNRVTREVGLGDHRKWPGRWVDSNPLRRMAGSAPQLMWEVRTRERAKMELGFLGRMSGALCPELQNTGRMQLRRDAKIVLMWSYLSTSWHQKAGWCIKLKCRRERKAGNRDLCYFFFSV